MTGAATSATDLFITFRLLARNVVRTWVDALPTAVRTHRPVYVSISGIARDALVWKLRRPSRLLVLRPQGADRAPPSYDHLMAQLVHQPSADGLAQVYSAWARNMEKELLGRYALVDEKRYAGRGQPLRRAQVPLLHGHHAARPKASVEATMWHLISDRFAELSHLRILAWTASRAEHDRALVRRLLKYRCPMSTLPALGFGGKGMRLIFQVIHTCSCGSLGRFSSAKPSDWRRFLLLPGLLHGRTGLQ